MSKVIGKLNNLGEKFLSTSTVSFKSVLEIYLPLLFDQAMIMIISMCNVAMISSSGEQAIAAVNMIDSLNLLLVNLFIAVATGGTVVVAQYKGKGEFESMGKAAAQAIASSFMIAFVLLVSMLLFAKPILGLLFQSAEQEVLDLGLIYFIGSCFSYPFFAINQSIIGAYRGAGEGKISMAFSIYINVLYLTGNFLLVKVFNLGVVGIAISICLCRAIGAVTCFIYMVFKSTSLRVKIAEIFSIKFKMQKSILMIGIPSAVEQIFFNGGKLLTQTYITGLGTTALAANAVVGSVTGMYCVPANTMVLTIITVVGQCIGAGKIDEAKRMIKNSICTANVLSAVICGIMLAMSPMLFSLYGTTKDVADMCFPILVLCAIGTPLIWSISFVTPSGLRGAGDAKFTSIASLCSMWMFRVILGYIFAFPFGLKLFGVYLAMVLEWGVRGSLFLLRLRGKKWYQHNII